MKKAKLIRLMFLGESLTGKTSMLDRLIHDKFNPDCLSSFGSEKTMYKLGKVQFNIWDTPGQEKFRSINKMLYKNSDIFILVYDITNRQSFDELENYWYPQVNDIAKNPSIYSYNCFSILCSWK